MPDTEFPPNQKHKENKRKNTNYARGTQQRNAHVLIENHTGNRLVVQIIKSSAIFNFWFYLNLILPQPLKPSTFMSTSIFRSLVFACLVLFSSHIAFGQKIKSGKATQSTTPQASAEARYTDYVNPFVGTDAHGHTYPGVVVPFGMIQPSPDTRLTGWDGCSGYHYSDSIVYGFSHTHLSGVGVSEYGDVLIMPTVGAISWQGREDSTSTKGYASRFRHSKEQAHPGYYAVQLEDDNIFAELTATTRVGVHRYTFPASREANIIMDLQHRDKVLESTIRVVGKNRIEGYRRSDAWARDQRVYFVAEFSKPFTQFGIATNDTLRSKTDSASGTNLKAFVRFTTKKGEQILVKVAISAVSVEGARKNLQAEVKDWNFDAVRKDADAAWQKELSAIQVSDGTPEQMRTFYTALYHTMNAPNVFMDVDGQYFGLDKKIHTAQDYTHHTIFSLWDTFRAAHPLYTIIQPKRTLDFIKTFLADYDDGARLPVWELAGNETDCMIGYHAVSVIADAAAKGITGFDMQKALRAMKHSAELNHFGLEAYKKQGFIGIEDEHESVSKTLEYAYDDWCIAQVAQMLGKREDYETYMKRAQYYKNLFDPATGFMRARKNGGWFAPFDPREVNFHYTEGNSWHYSFFALQDLDGLTKLLGGKERLDAKIDALFTADPHTTGREQADVTGLIGQYAQGNEPSHHAAYLYNYAGKPWKTQAMVRRILDSLFTPQADGLSGNDDCGQMSAWYVLSSLGFYSVTPGSPVYAIGSPLFGEARLRLENGKTFVVKATNNGKNNVYIQSATLNGKPYSTPFLAHADILAGGELVLTMGATPNTAWGVTENGNAISGIRNVPFVPVPIIEATNHSFKVSMDVRMSHAEQGTKILYTTNGSEPSASTSATTKLYTKPFAVNTTCTIKTIAVNAQGEKSFTATAQYSHVPNNWNVRLLSDYVPQYGAGGADALVDGLRGGRDFRTGAWQGYWGKNFEAIVDMGEVKSITTVGAGFLQDVRPWIFMPKSVEFAVSVDGKTFTNVATIQNTTADTDYTVTTRDFMQTIPAQKARYVKIFARNYGTLPRWHEGFGGEAYIFVDEIIIR